MNNKIKIASVILSLTFGSLSFASSKEEIKKFTFDGAAIKHPVTIELESVEYKPKGVELYLKVQNNSDTGVDFSRASWDIQTGAQKGFIQESEFDGLIIQPRSKRYAKISFGFDESLNPSFRQERSQGSSTIHIENISTFKNQKLPKIILKNY